MTSDTTEARAARVARYLSDEAEARKALEGHTDAIRQRLRAWQEAQGEWFSDTLLEIVAEFIAFDDRKQENPPMNPDIVEATEDAWRAAVAETNRLQRELDISNADHIALWIEANTVPDEPMNQCATWLACRIVEAHEAALTAARPAIMEEAAGIAEAEKVDAEGTGTTDDAAYNMACDHIATAIRAAAVK